jgi:lauroyl/myristoyl acyltransferase
MCVALAGRHVRLPRGPWEIACRSGALVIPTFSVRQGFDTFEVTVEEPFRVHASGELEADVRCAAERYAHLLEAQIRRNPGQWTPFEDFWKVHRCG